MYGYMIILIDRLLRRRDRRPVKKIIISGGTSGLQNSLFR